MGVRCWPGERWTRLRFTRHPLCWRNPPASRYPHCGCRLATPRRALANCPSSFGLLASSFTPERGVAYSHAARRILSHAHTPLARLASLIVGVPLFCLQFLHHFDFQISFRQDLLEPCIFLSELAYLPHIIYLNLSKLPLPTTKGLLRAAASRVKVSAARIMRTIWSSVNRFFLMLVLLRLRKT